MIETQPVRRLVTVQLLIGILTAALAALVGLREGDPLVFLPIADRIVGGAIPYRDFPVEYPPVALLHIVLPRVLVGLHASPLAYQLVFGLISLALTIAAGWVVVRLARLRWSAQPERETLGIFLAMALALWPSVIWRFDIMPALLTVAAVLAVARGQPGWAGLGLGLGTAVKLYPAFLAPVLGAYYLVGRRWKSMALLGFGLIVTVGAIVAQFYLIAGSDSLSFLFYQRDRGVEIESVIGGLALLADSFAGIDAHVSFAFGSFQVTSPAVQALATPGLIFQALLIVSLVGGGAYAFINEARRRGTVAPATLVAYVVATLLVVMLANKVFSPQYMCWLLPFGALLPARKALLLLVACVLTTLVYPLWFDALRAGVPIVVLVLNLRNLLMLALFVWLVFPRRERGSKASADHQIDAMLEKPPRRPAATPNISRPIASRRCRGRMTTIRSAAKPTIAIFASVSPGKPASSAN